MKRKKTSKMRASSALLLFLIFLINLNSCSSYVIILSQNEATEGKILFEAQITNEIENLAANNLNYTYKVSHHKTQPWVHRFAHFDKKGNLKLRRSLNDCFGNEHKSSFLLYIDIIAAPHSKKYENGLKNGRNFIISQPDYVSYPIFIIIQDSPECSAAKSLSKTYENSEKYIRRLDREIFHYSRSVDDIYVSYAVQNNFCAHSSEKLGNLKSFLSESVKNSCNVSHFGTDDHFIGVEEKTQDIVLKADFCLFDNFYAATLGIKLSCQGGEKNKILSWDQMVHFILHAQGGTGGGSGEDGQFLERHPIHRMRREMRNQAPYFSETLYKASVPEEQPPGITVTELIAVDPEGSSLTYSMSSLLDSRSQQFFTLDPKSGIVTTIEKLDREKMEVHYFRIVATDSGSPPRTGTATLEVNVVDVNDHEPKFEQSSYSVSIREGLSVGSTVLSVRARDEDSGKNGEIAYSLLNSHDIEDAFRIDSSTGVITTALPLDREKKDEYNLLIQASDSPSSALDRKTNTVRAKISILDENDNYPIFSEKTYGVTVAENFDVSNYPVIAQISASDADEGVNAALRYSIIGGNNQNHFSIDSITGEVTLLKPVDYEQTRSFRLNIRAIDSGNPSRSNSTQLVVTIEDKNDNAPKFFQTIFQETIPENLPVGSSALKIQAFDSDDGLNSKLSYRLSYREPPEKFPFEIEPSSGWLLTNKALDREEQARYDFDVIAADFGEAPLSSTASVVILVQDINDNDPVFNPKLYEIVVSEQEAPGTPVLELKATDPDEGSRLIYEIVEGNTRGRFSISTQNNLGRISVAQGLDFKSERKFVLSVKVTDSGGRFDIATIYIDILDSNSNPPTFQNTPYSIKIFEDVPVGTTVFTVTATDNDSGQNAQILYSFVKDGDENEGYDDFMIDANSGEIIVSKSLDRERIPGYILTVSAKDKGIPPMSDTTDVEIVLHDVNDLAPQFEKEFYSTKVSENVPVGTSILQVAANDKDEGKNGLVRYSFSTFSDGDGTFSVDPVSGVIRTVKSLDRETVSRYDLLVLATDQGSPQLTGKTNIKIDIEDVNDNPPMFESDRIRFFIQENSPLGSTVGRLQAYDPDEGSNAFISYSIVGGVDANSFTLVSHQQPNGGSSSADILTKIESLDFESKRKKFDIVVRASSMPLRNDVHVEIHVQDVNDNAPVLKPFEIILNTYKDHFPIGPIGKVPASDADLTDRLQYSVLSGNKANLIYLNESTGLITLSPYLDSNVPLTAKIEILVSDGLNEVRSEMTLRTHYITDELLFNSVTVQLADMTIEGFLSPLYTQFTQALSLTLNSPRENILIFSIQEEIEGSHSFLNVSFACRKSSSGSEEYFPPSYIKERLSLNRPTLSKLTTVSILPFSDDLCLLEPCPNFENCLSVLRFRNASSFISTDVMLFRSIVPWQTFACRCPVGFTGLKEHYLCDAEVNLCFSSPCQNGGTCLRREGGYVCNCVPEFTGSSCEIHVPITESCGSKNVPSFKCTNCSSKGDYLNSYCELTARSFHRGSYVAFPGLKNRYRLSIELSFATHQRNGLLLYNGRYSERYDFLALEIVNSTLRFSFSLGSLNVTTVTTGKIVSDGLWHSLQLHYFNKTATLKVDECDVELTLSHPTEFPPSSSCGGRSSPHLDERCNLLLESCPRLFDLNGPLYVGGIPFPSPNLQIESSEFGGCIRGIKIDHKALDFNNYVMEHGTVAGCPEKKNFCASQPCKNGGKCIEGWGTYRCLCPDSYGQKDCSEDAKPVWTLREGSFLIFSPQMRPLTFPWFNSLSLRTLSSSGTLLTITLSNNETLTLSMHNNGLLTYELNSGSKLPVGLPRVNDGHWHNVEVKWMTAEIWFSLDYGQTEITLPIEAKLGGVFVTEVSVGGGDNEAFSGCVQDVRVGSSKTYLRKPSPSSSSTLEGCSLATACLGASCPPRSTCLEEGGRSKCVCDAGFIGLSCSPVCELSPCRNNGSCVVDGKSKKGYRCSCDERFYRGEYCEEELELDCPSTWWNWPDCVPCDCPAEKNYSPECDKKTGQCKCKEYHYAKDGSCVECGCYSVGSVSKACDLSTGKCQCRPNVFGNRCDTCHNPFAEVTLRGCEVIPDACPASSSSSILWPRTPFSSTSSSSCPPGSLGLSTRLCSPSPLSWSPPDLFNCTSAPLAPLLGVLAQVESGSLPLSASLVGKLGRDLKMGVEGREGRREGLYGNDLWVGLRVVGVVVREESRAEGLRLSHRQDKNFIKNLAESVSRITESKYAPEWKRIQETYPMGSDTLLKLFEEYLAHLVLTQEETFTNPFEIVTDNMVIGLDTVEPESTDGKNFEDLEIQSTYDLYEVSKVRKRAVKIPKYNNIVMHPQRYHNKATVWIPLDILGLSQQNDGETKKNGVVGYIEYNSLFDLLPSRYQSDVERRFNSNTTAAPPLITLALLGQNNKLVSGKQGSPIRITYEVVGKYIDGTNPQCVVWEEGGEDREGGWTTRYCVTDLSESFQSAFMTNVIQANCTCWHLSTYALIIDNNEQTEFPLPSLLEEIITYVAFTIGLILIFGALLALGLLKGPLPSTITNTIHKHLLISIFCALGLYFIGLKLRGILSVSDIGCRGVAIGLHLTWLSTFSWLLGSALHLRRMFTEVRDVNHGSAIFYFALGYAFPLLCVCLSLGVKATHYGNTFFCWLSLYEGIVWGMVGPILLCVLLSLFTFLIAVRAAFTLKDSVIDSGSMRTLLWMDLTLLPLCGVVWTLSLLGANERSSVWHYALSLSVICLSSYISLSYCVFNTRVQGSLILRAGHMFKGSDNNPQSHVSRSALAYRSEGGGGGTLRSDDFRGDIFRGVRSLGISTASTTSRSTTKTSSSPYRSDVFHTFGTVTSLSEKTRLARDVPDSPMKTYSKKRGSAEEEEISSDGGHTLELASSHSSDDDETTVNGQIRTTRNNDLISDGGGGHSSGGNSGSDNETPQSGGQNSEYFMHSKDLNSSENLYVGHYDPSSAENPYGQKLSFLYHQQESVNDLNSRLHHQMSPLTMSGYPHLGSTPLHLPTRHIDSPISPVQEITDEAFTPPEHEGAQDVRGVENLGLDENEELYGGSMTSGVLV